MRKNKCCKVLESLAALCPVVIHHGLPLDARRAAFCKGAHLIRGRHGGIARKGGQQRAVRPT
jgi:hypothetical protein